MSHNANTQYPYITPVGPAVNVQDSDLRTRRIQFDDHPTVYPVFGQGPPTATSISNDPPTAPRPGLLPLPATPQQPELVLPSQVENQHLVSSGGATMDVREGGADGRARGMSRVGFADSAADAYYPSFSHDHAGAQGGYAPYPAHDEVCGRAPDPVPAPASYSPVHSDSERSASPDSFDKPSPPSSPVSDAADPALGDLAAILRHFPVAWDLRKDMRPPGLKDEWYAHRAFASERKACFLRFVPPVEGGAEPEREAWKEQLASATSAALTVGQVLDFIREQLFADAMMYEDHPNYAAVCAAKAARVLRALNEPPDAFKQIDLYVDGCVFRGLQQEGEGVYRVLLQGVRRTPSSLRL